MDKRFNRVVFRATVQQPGNIHLALHPFPLGGYFTQHTKESCGREYESAPQWARDLANRMWDEVPGLKYLSCWNALLVLQHHGIFDDAEIVAVVEPIVRAVLNTHALLLWGIPDDRLADEAERAGEAVA